MPAFAIGAAWLGELHEGDALGDGTCGDPAPDPSLHTRSLIALTFLSSLLNLTLLSPYFLILTYNRLSSQRGEEIKKLKETQMI